MATEFYEDDETLGRIPMYPPFQKIRKVKKSRIQTECEFCKGDINIGDPCEYWVGMDLGSFHYYRICNTCTTI